MHIQKDTTELRYLPQTTGFLKLHAVFTEIDRNIVDRSVNTYVAKQ